MFKEFAYALAGLVVLAYAADLLYSLRDDPREPRRVKSRIPLLGHLIGIIQYGTGYYSMISKTTTAEMYTLGILGFKMYICNSRALMPAIQKHAKTLSFTPFVTLAAKRFCSVSDDNVDRYANVVDTLHKATKNALAPGPYLDDQNMRTGKRLLEDLADLTSGTREIMLLEWTRHAIVQASASGVYGEQHPFVDLEVEEAFWTWHKYVPLQVAGLYFLAKTGLAAREKIFNAYRSYIRNPPPDTAQIYKERLRIFRDEANMDIDEIAKLESGFPVAIFSNTAPTTYWAIYELFSRPRVLEEVRHEIERNAVRRDDKGFVLDVAALKTQCPLLLSVLQETQRTRHVHANIRQVMADTELEGENGQVYLLKSGNYLQMPGAPIHNDASIYGATASAFDPYRFVPKTSSSTQLPSSSFLAWGAPPHLCPARQFASTEVLILLALLAVRVDLQPAGKGGVWDRNPAVLIGEMVTALSPKKDVRMKVEAREDWRGEWRLEMGESKTRVSLASG